MKRPKSRSTRRAGSEHPTETELEILEVLWNHGPCTLGTVHEQFGVPRGNAYTTTQKMLQVLREKGLAKVSQKQRPALYEATEPRQKTQRKLLDYVAEKAFGGSTLSMILNAVSSEQLTTEELNELKSCIRKAEREQRNAEPN